MHVSGVEVPQQQTAQTNAAEQQPATGGIFAAFLKSAVGSSFSTIRLEAGTGIGQQITAEESLGSGPDTADDGVVASNSDIDTPDSGTGADSTTADDNPANTETRKEDDQATVQDGGAAAGLDGALDTLQEDPNGQNVLLAAATQQNGAEARTATQTQQPAAVNSIGRATEVPDETLLNAAREAANGKSNAQNRITAQVTDTPQQLISKPASTLAASAAVAAQADRQRADGAATQNSADRTTEGSGNLLLAEPANKQARTRNAPGQAATAQLVQAKPAEQGQQPAPQGAAFNAVLAQQSQAPNGASLASRAATGVVRGDVAPVAPTSGLSAGATAASPVSRPIAPPPAPPAPPPSVTSQIAVQIQKSVAQGLDRIKIQLKPAELGRVEIKLDVMQDGRVAATIMADRPETLEMLQRDSRGLQQALQDAGLKSGASNLSFNLGGGNASDDQQAADSEGRAANDDIAHAADGSDEDTPRRSGGSSVIDVEV